MGGPPSVSHRDGLSRFLGDVRRLADSNRLEAESTFGSYMELLFKRLVAIDQSFGWYRDKFVVHLPADMSLTSSSFGITTPLDFEVSHARQEQVAEARLRALGKALDEIERSEDISLGSGDKDPQKKASQAEPLAPKSQRPEEHENSPKPPCRVGHSLSRPPSNCDGARLSALGLVDRIHSARRAGERLTEPVLAEPRRTRNRKACAYPMGDDAVDHTGTTRGRHFTG